MTNIAKFEVWTWNAWDRFFIQALRPDVPQVELDIAARSGGGMLDLSSTADCLLLQINLSLPGLVPLYRNGFLESLEQRGIQVWNRAIVDITKRTIQSHNRLTGLPCTTAEQDGPDNELLIIKTNYNARGFPEGRLSDSEREALQYPEIRPARIHPDTEYAIVPRGQIDTSLWSDPYFHIERYITCSHHEYSRLYFVRDRLVLSYGRSTGQVRRMEGDIERVNFSLMRSSGRDPICRALLSPRASEALETGVRFAESFGLDYGVLDLVIDDQNVAYVVDVNPTPYWGNDKQPGMLEHLREGLP